MALSRLGTIPRFPVGQRGVLLRQQGMRTALRRKDLTVGERSERGREEGENKKLYLSRNTRMYYYISCDAIGSIGKTALTMKKPNAEGLYAAAFHPPQRRIREILGRFVRRKSVSLGQPPAAAPEKLSAATDASGDLVMSELLATASGLVDATESFLRSISPTRLTKTDFLRRSTDLLAIYDEYLEALKSEIQSPSESRPPGGETSQWTQKDVIKLFVAFDHDRQVLAGIFGLWQQDFSDETSGETVLPPIEPDQAPVKEERGDG